MVAFSDRVLDLGLASLASETNALFICSAPPTDYATALSLRRAQKTGTIFGSPVDGIRGGRKVSSVTITDGVGLADGNVTDWAAVDTIGLRLLANGPLRTSRTVTNGGTFSLLSFSLEIDGSDTTAIALSASAGFFATSVILAKASARLSTITGAVIAAGDITITPKMLLRSSTLLSGAGILSAAATTVGSGATAWSGAAILAGSGAFAAAALRIDLIGVNNVASLSPALENSPVLAGHPVGGWDAAAVLSATGSLSAKALSISKISAVLAGAGAQAANATLPSAGDPFWTVFTETSPSGEGSGFVGAGTRKIYVSQSTGNDGNTGTLASPKKTVSAGKALLRNGKPDWLLFKKGDTWTDECPAYFTSLSGVSSSEPMLISSYGTGARPLFKVNGGVNGSGIATNPGSDFIACVGLEFYAYRRNPADPGYVSGDSTVETDGTRFYGDYKQWILLEDCKFSYFSDGIIYGTGNVFRIRRCVVTDSWYGAGHSQGAYIELCDNPFLEENYWDHCGWHATAPGGGQTIYNRSLYIHEDCGPAVGVLRNIFTRSSSSGMQLRTGGTMTDCLLFENDYGFDVGHQNDFDGAPAISVANVQNNITMDTIGVLGTDSGIHVLQAHTSAVQVKNNIVLRCGHGMVLDSDCTGVVATNNTVFTSATGVVQEGSGNTITPNDVDLGGTNNNPGGQAPSEPFPDPNRTIAGYCTSVGISPATADGFRAACRAQNKEVGWDTRLGANAVNNYFRAGFGKAAI